MANLRRRGMSFPFLDESKDSETREISARTILNVYGSNL